MKRLIAAMATLAGLGGCYGEATYVEPTPTYQTTVEEVPYDAPAPISVTVAPPPSRYETVLTCGYGTMWIPGRWEWSGRWYWARGHCSVARSGYVYMAPRYDNGVYYRGYWGRPGYVAPAPVYAPPAPVYAPPAYRPAPVYTPGPVVAPPAPVYRPAPVYAPPAPVVAPPAPVYRPAPVVAPPAPVYRPAPAPVYAPPAPVYRPAPAPVYRPAPAPVYQPAPPPAYRPPSPMPSPAPSPPAYRQPSPAPMPSPAPSPPAYRAPSPAPSQGYGSGGSPGAPSYRPSGGGGMRVGPPR